VVNLYPFQEVTGRKGVSLETAIENIDIGGTAMIRSAAKNYSAVTVICDLNDLNIVLKELEENNGKTTLAFRESLAAKAFKKTSEYDKTISSYLSKPPATKDSFPENLTLNLKLKQSLRYGENPHQRGALYTSEISNCGLSNAEILQGKELSFNNYLDTGSRSRRRTGS
jgi:phosphoribosylaminoimidazolecarboxamide formyltransferase/IMP cyclohydrolase